MVDEGSNKTGIMYFSGALKLKAFKAVRLEVAGVVRIGAELKSAAFVSWLPRKPLK